MKSSPRSPLQTEMGPGWAGSVERAPELDLLPAQLRHPAFHVVRMARQRGAQHPAAVGGDDDVVLDADADAPEGLRRGQVVALEVQAGLDGENVPGLEAAAAVLLIPGVRAVVDVEAEHLRCAVKGVAAVELPVLGQSLLRAHGEDAERLQSLGEHSHGGAMRSEED